MQERDVSVLQDFGRGPIILLVRYSRIVLGRGKYCLARLAGLQFTNECGQTSLPGKEDHHAEGNH
jgi:hypothetical protein